MSKDGASGRCKVRSAPVLAGVAVLALACPAAARTPYAALSAFAAALPPAPTGEADCLAQAIYYEARGEPREGREAVAQVVLNRLHDRIYPKTICGVVFQGAPRLGCQFTFACDGSRARPPSSEAWRDAQTIAGRALSSDLASAVGDATHYHAVWMRPSWSLSMTPGPRIGGHQFYSVGDAHGLTRTATTVAISTPPEAVAFSVWGLQVAVVSPAPPRR